MKKAETKCEQTGIFTHFYINRSIEIVLGLDDLKQKIRWNQHKMQYNRQYAIIKYV